MKQKLTILLAAIVLIGSYFVLAPDAKAQFATRVVNPIVNLIGLTTTGTGVIPNSNLDIGASGQRVPNGYFTNLNVSSCTGCGGGGGGGADGNWVFFNNTGLRMTTTTNQVVMGASATSTTSAKLEVIGNQYVSGVASFGTTTLAAGAAITVAAGINPVPMIFDSTAATGMYNIYRNASTDFGYTGAGAVLFPATGGALNEFAIRASTALTFGIGTSERMRLASTGNVGIGTTTPYSKLSVTGQVAAQNFVATSTTATSILSGNVLIGTSTAFGFNAGQPLVINTSVNGAAQMNLINTNNGTAALVGYFLGNSKTTNLGYLSQYYSGMAMGGAYVNMTGFGELKPDDLAIVNSNGMVKIGSNSGNAASSSVAFYTLLGFNTPADMLLNGYGNLGLGTTTVNARLDVVGASNATTSLVRFSTGTGTATTTNFLLQQNGLIGLSTTTASSTLDLYGSFAGRISLISATTTIDSTYYTVKATTTTNAVGVTLPPTTGACGRVYNVTKKNSAGFAVTITPAAGDTFGDGTSSKTITTQGLTYQIQADCSDRTWIILN